MDLDAVVADVAVALWTSGLGVEAVALGGSRAIDLDDEWSDRDVFVLIDHRGFFERLEQVKSTIKGASNASYFADNGFVSGFGFYCCAIYGATSMIDFFVNSTWSAPNTRLIAKAEPIFDPFGHFSLLKSELANSVTDECGPINFTRVEQERAVSNFSVGLYMVLKHTKRGDLLAAIHYLDKLRSGAAAILRAYTTEIPYFSYGADSRFPSDVSWIQDELLGFVPESFTPSSIGNSAVSISRNLLKRADGVLTKFPEPRSWIFTMLEEFERMSRNE